MSKYKVDITGINTNNIKVLNKDYRINHADIEENQVKKYQYIEYRKSIPDGESMEHSTIIIQETKQDKSVAKKSQKYIIPASIAGIILGAIIDYIINENRLLDSYTIEAYIDEIERKIESAEKMKTR